MIVKTQKPLIFINACKCKVEQDLLQKAMLVYADRPICEKKTIFLFGSYAGVSIHGKKYHVHRLTMEAELEEGIPDGFYVHHKNGDKLDNRLSNLEIIKASEHQSLHNKGRKQSKEHIMKRIDATTKTRYGHSIYENPKLLEGKDEKDKNWV